MNRYITIFTAVILAVLCCGLSERAVADGATGERMLSNCQTAIRIRGGDEIPPVINLAEAHATAFCLGFVRGVARTLVFWKHIPDRSPVACLPDRSISDLQGARIFVKYGIEHPEKLHEPEIILLLAALMEAFPCE